MGATKKVITDVDADANRAVLMEKAFEAAQDVEEEVAISATDKLTVLNTSDHNVCLTSGILAPGDEGIATRAELGTLWQFLELAEK